MILRIVILTLLLSSCGQIGPLYLPEKPESTTEPDANTKAEIVKETDD